jgi:glycopeptide antibiotics resistance protein
MPGILAAIANFLPFMPIGFLVRIRWPSFDGWSAVLALGIGLSLGIETLQSAWAGTTAASTMSS